jgi:uncharacterized protein YcbX
MKTIEVTSIIRYPLKSCKGTSLQKCDVIKKGLLLDRHWALFDKDNQAITGRQYPSLLDLEIIPNGNEIRIMKENSMILKIPTTHQGVEHETLKVFSYSAYGNEVSKTANEWFSEYLGVKCRLMSSSVAEKRKVLSKHGGRDGDILGFSDQAPLLLISEASLADLNERMDSPIGMERFRPNIVVKGCDAYEEDSWTEIAIGDCRLKIIQRCERCIFTTIDPVTKLKSEDREPLTTLQKYRQVDSGGVVFGVHLVPTYPGTISIGDQLTLLE